jgi:hypothetical protein
MRTWCGPDERRFGTAQELMAGPIRCALPIRVLNRVFAFQLFGEVAELLGEIGIAAPLELSAGINRVASEPSIGSTGARDIESTSVVTVMR